MKAADRARLARLRRLEKVRAVARQMAAVEAAEAEGSLAQLRALAERTRHMAGEYGTAMMASGSVAHGEALHHLGRFVGGLIAITRTTEGDAARAKAIADAKLAYLGECERRRDAVKKQATKLERLIAKPVHAPSSGARRNRDTEFGTPLESAPA